MKKLNPRQQRFVNEYAIDQNATQAAIRAGYSLKGVAVTAHNLLRNTNISTAVNAKLAQLTKETDNTYVKRVSVADECLEMARVQGDYKGMLVANDQLIELGGYYRKSVKVEGGIEIEHVTAPAFTAFIEGVIAKRGK